MITVLISLLFVAKYVASYEFNNDEINEDLEPYENSGGGNGDLTPGHLTPAIIVALVVTAIIGLMLMMLATSCVYYKIQRMRRRGRGMKGVNTESKLNMVDYDELSVEHATISDVNMNESTS